LGRRTEKYSKTKKICNEDLLWILKVEDMFSVLPEGKTRNSKGFVWGRRQIP